MAELINFTNNPVLDGTETKASSNGRASKLHSTLSYEKVDGCKNAKIDTLFFLTTYLQRGHAFCLEPAKPPFKRNLKLTFS